MNHKSNSFMSGLRWLLLVLLTFSYYGRLRECTILPIDRIAEAANTNPNCLLAALTSFRIKKQHDLDFIRKAVRGLFLGSETTLIGLGIIERLG
jgi:hypothetical protein